MQVFPEKKRFIDSSKCNPCQSSQEVCGGVSMCRDPALCLYFSYTLLSSVCFWASAILDRWVSFPCRQIPSLNEAAAFNGVFSNSNWQIVQSVLLRFTLLDVTKKLNWLMCSLMVSVWSIYAWRKKMFLLKRKCQVFIFIYFC